MGHLGFKSPALVIPLSMSTLVPFIATDDLILFLLGPRNLSMQALDLSRHGLDLDAQVFGIDGNVSKTVLQLFISAGKI